MVIPEYNLIISQHRYKLIRVGTKKATITFKKGNEVQQYIGWLTLNRDCKVYVHNSNGEVGRIINSGGKG